MVAEVKLIKLPIPC